MDIKIGNSRTTDGPAGPETTPKPDHAGALAYLETRGIGPAESLVLEPAKRLTLITGDNGLGKTFLLECAWWALTGTWAEKPIFPNPETPRINAEIGFAIDGESAAPEKIIVRFDPKNLIWPRPGNRPTIPGLIVYARVDGSFAVWDPARQPDGPGRKGAHRVAFSNTEVWNGSEGRIEGLIRDWVRWQGSPLKHPFEKFVAVLAKLSPPDLGALTPSDPVRIPGDPREIPTIKHPYGVTPVVYASAGVRRIIAMAYLIVWAWNEHVVAAGLAREQPQRRMVVLVDEMEAHLHPRWQRVVLPALMSVGEMIAGNDLQVQYIVATHSPLVMASAEGVFDPEIDSLVGLELATDGKVTLNEIDFAVYGDVSSWLTSPVFGLKQARSAEAEAAIEAAKALQMKGSPSPEGVKDVSARLTRCLAPDDKFWPRWVFFAEKLGVSL